MDVYERWFRDFIDRVAEVDVSRVYYGVGVTRARGARPQVHTWYDAGWYATVARLPGVGALQVWYDRYLDAGGDPLLSVWINAPRRVISSIAKRLPQPPTAAESPSRKDLEEIALAAKKASTLTKQLLAFSRQQPLAPQSVDLNTLATDMERLLARTLSEDVELVMTLAPRLGLVFADPGQLEQAMMNLVVNARDAMPDGGVIAVSTSNVEIGASTTSMHGEIAPGSYVVLTVTHTGCGMDEATSARIFEPFFSTKEIGKGTGLGLAARRRDRHIGHGRGHAADVGHRRRDENRRDASDHTRALRFGAPRRGPLAAEHGHGNGIPAEAVHARAARAQCACAFRIRVFRYAGLSAGRFPRGVL